MQNLYEKDNIQKTIKTKKFDLPGFFCFLNQNKTKTLKTIFSTPVGNRSLPAESRCGAWGRSPPEAKEFSLNYAVILDFFKA